MRSVHTETDIGAAPEQVWAILTAFTAFPAWNPFIRRASGQLQPGERLTIKLRLYGPMLTTFRPVVTVIEPGREIRWRARLGMPGLMDVERVFQVLPRDDGGTRFIQQEDCTGLLAGPLFAAGLGARLHRGYRAMNRALKARAEGEPAPPSKRPKEAHGVSA